MRNNFYLRRDQLELPPGFELKTSARVHLQTLEYHIGKLVTDMNDTVHLIC